MDALTTSANAQVDDFASQFDRGEVQFFDASDNKIGWSQLRAPAFEPALNAKAEAKGLPHDIFVESSGVDAQIDYAVLTSPDGKRERLSVSTSGGGGDVVVSGLQIQDGGTTQTVEAFSIQRGDVDPSLDDPGSVELTLPTDGETYTEGGVGNWQAEIDLEDLRVKRVELEESTDGGSTWTTKDTIYYTKDPESRTDAVREKGPREHSKVGYRDTYKEGVWTVDASATHVRAVMVDENSNRTTSSPVSISTEAPAATYSTLSDLLAADPTQFSVGATVIVEDQEDRGQEFVLSENAERTDHVSVFVADSDVSSEVTDQIKFQRGDDLSNTDVVAGSLRVDYETGSQTMTGFEMHGTGDGRTGRPIIDYKTGEFTGGGHLPNDHQSEAPFSYKHATSPRRWIRKTHGRFDVRWAGGVIGDQSESQAQTNSHARNWCTLAARDWIDRHEGRRWTFVDHPGMLPCLFQTAAAEDVMPRGTGPEQSVPGKDWVTRGGVKMPDGLALWWLDGTHTNTQQQYNILNGGVGGERWGCNVARLGNGLGDPQSYADKVGCGRYYKVDPNVRNNTNVFNNSDYFDVSNKLQNGRAWTGFKGNQIDSVGEVVKQGCGFAYQYLHVTKAGSDQLQVRTGDQSTLSHNVMLEGGGAGDHPIYSVPCNPENSLEDFTITGMNSIGSGYQVYQTNMRNVTLKDFEANPKRTDGFTGTWAIVNHRGGTGTYPGPMANDYRNGNKLTLKNATIDMRGAPSKTNAGGYELFRLKTARTFGVEIENMVIFTGGTNDYTYALVNGLIGSEDVSIKNITVVVHPDDEIMVCGRGQTYGALSISGVELKTSTPDHTQSGIVGILKSDRNEKRHSWVKIKSSQFDPKFILRDGNGGAVTTVVRQEDKYNNKEDFIFLEDTNVNNGDDVLGPAYFYNCRIKTYGNGTVKKEPFGKSWMRDVVDQDGRTSDDSGVYTTDVSEESQNFVRIKTNMLWTPQEINAEVVDGNLSVQSTSYVQSDGSSVNSDDPRSEYIEVSLSGSIASDDQIRIAWDAHFTPMDRLSREGIFLANPISDREQAYGNSTTLEIETVFSSIEKDPYSTDRIEESATSSDTNALSTSFNSDGTSLTLNTETALGTPTITLKKQFYGLGEMETTFQVDVYGIKADVQENGPATTGGDVTLSINVTEQNGRTINKVEYYDQYGTASETLLGTNSTGNDSSWPITYTTQDNSNLDVTAVVTHDVGVEDFGPVGVTVLDGTTTDPLDSVAGSAEVALSHRRLTINYSGPAYRVYRVSDGVQADVEFDGGGVVSLSSGITNTSDSNSYTDLADFAGGAEVRLETIYNQGAGNDWIYNDANGRPGLMNNGEFLGDLRPTSFIGSNGGNDWLNNNQAIPLQQVYCVERPTSTGAILTDGNKPSYKFVGLNPLAMASKHSTPTFRINSTEESSYPDGDETGNHLQVSILEGSEIENYLYSTGWPGDTNDAGHDGEAGELIIFDGNNALSDADRDTLEADQQSWFGIE